MCEPMTMMMLGGAALSGTKMMADQKAAEAAGESQAEQVITSANHKQQAINSEAVEVNRRASQTATKAELEAARTASSARVQAGEAGIGGQGVNRLLGEIGRQSSENLAVTASNVQGDITGLNSQKDMTQRNAENQIEQINKSMEGPSALDALLTIGSGALSGYSMGAGMGLFGAATKATTAGSFTEAALSSGMGGAGAQVAAPTGVSSIFSFLRNNPTEYLTPGAEVNIKRTKRTGFARDYLSSP